MSESFLLQNMIQVSTDRAQYNDLQSLLCATLQVRLILIFLIEFYLDVCFHHKMRAVNNVKTLCCVM